MELSSSASAAQLSISDQGVGIPPGDLAGLFEPFGRSESSKASIPGVGLGLSVARRIIRAHHGEISVESNLGKGSTITMRLPLRR